MRERLLGQIEGDPGAPTLVCVAGVHGNEPSGVAALERVFTSLESGEPKLGGSFYGFAGNVQALAAGVRYLAKDLNRQWISERVMLCERGGKFPTSDPEDGEQRELYAALREVFTRARGPVFVFDLHSASSVTPPFLIFGDTLRNRDFAMHFPSPIVLGLEEQINGTVMEWVSSLGHVSIAFEAGQHDDPTSVDRQEAAIWVALAASGVAAREDVPDFEGRREFLKRSARDIPRILEIADRHAITPEDQFTMKPGFRNFDPVKAGDLLANDRRGEIHAPGKYRLLFPLYQKLGEDGYFLTRPVNPVWLAVSAFLRKTGAATVAPYLPGVARHPRRRDTLVVDRRVARFGVRQIFHLLGYRLEASRGTTTIVRKRDVPKGR